MPGIGFQDKFKRLKREYLLQSALNDAGNIVCSLFHEGKLLSTQFLPSLDNLSERDLSETLHEIHRQYLSDFDSLLALVEKTMESEKPELIEKLGKTLYNRQLYDEGLKLLENAVERFPDYHGYRDLLGKIYVAQNRIGDAERELLKAVKLAPGFPDYRNHLGISYLKLNKAVAAVNEFKKATEINIYYHNAFYNLGLGYILNGIVREDYDMARNIAENCREAFSKATLFNPGYLSPEYHRGQSSLDKGRFRDAYEDLQKASRAGEIASFQSELLEMYLRNVHGTDEMTEEGTNDYIERLNSIIKTNPGYADLHNEIGMAYTIMGKLIIDKAIGHFEQALEINPDFERAGKNLKLSRNDLKGFEVLLGAILK
ncbi:MAG: tetratricopeptide repeat protein [candidate division Zixibacteria bacterium]